MMVIVLDSSKRVVNVFYNRSERPRKIIAAPYRLTDLRISKPSVIRYAKSEPKTAIAMLNKQSFIDTNLFLLFFTNDVVEQADVVEELLDRAARAEIELVTSVMVVAEVVWTLESIYKLSPNDIKEKVLALLNTPGLTVESSDIVLQAIVWYVEKNVDFIDAYHAAWMRRQKVQHIFTFDRKHFGRFEHIAVTVPGIQT